MLLLLTIALPLLDSAVLNSASGEDGFHLIFDGKSLDGWEGNQKLWRVENGVLIGETTTPLEKTTYLIWRQGTVDDFELTLSYRITGGNSGIQYRSQDLGEFRVTGYHLTWNPEKIIAGFSTNKVAEGLLRNEVKKSLSMPLESRNKTVLLARAKTCNL